MDIREREMERERKRRVMEKEEKRLINREDLKKKIFRSLNRVFWLTKNPTTYVYGSNSSVVINLAELRMCVKLDESSPTIYQKS